MLSQGAKPVIRNGVVVVAVVQVEFYGIPRARAGVVKVTATAATLGDLIVELSSMMPALAESCFDGRTLKAGYTANLRGDVFTTHPDTTLRDGDAVLILSLDAGG